MYQRVITPSAKRSLKRLPYRVREDLLGTSSILETNPFAGEKLSGSLSPIPEKIFMRNSKDCSANKNSALRTAFSRFPNKSTVQYRYGHSFPEKNNAAGAEFLIFEREALAGGGD